MSHINIISVNQADKLLSEDTSAILLDVREAADFQREHHPKAQQLTEPMLNLLLTSVTKQTTLIVYCYHGNLSPDIAHLFSDHGFKSCYSVDGGYGAWKLHTQQLFPLSKRADDWLKAKQISNRNINAHVDAHLRTPLMLAAKAGQSDIVFDLIEAGANPNQKDLHGNNAFWYALQGQNGRCIRLLINADVETDNRNCFGFTALHYAVGMQDITSILEAGLGSNALARMQRPPRSNHHYQRMHSLASQLAAA